MLYPVLGGGVGTGLLVKSEVELQGRSIPAGIQVGSRHKVSRKCPESLSQVVATDSLKGQSREEQLRVCRRMGVWLLLKGAQQPPVWHETNR